MAFCPKTMRLMGRNWMQWLGQTDIGRIDWFYSYSYLFSRGGLWDYAEEKTLRGDKPLLAVEAPSTTAASMLLLACRVIRVISGIDRENEREQNEWDRWELEMMTQERDLYLKAIYLCVGPSNAKRCEPSKSSNNTKMWSYSNLTSDTSTSKECYSHWYSCSVASGTLRQLTQFHQPRSNSF